MPRFEANGCAGEIGFSAPHRTGRCAQKCRRSDRQPRTVSLTRNSMSAGMVIPLIFCYELVGKRTVDDRLAMPKSGPSSFHRRNWKTLAGNNCYSFFVNFPNTPLGFNNLSRDLRSRPRSSARRGNTFDSFVTHAAGEIPVRRADAVDARLLVDAAKRVHRSAEARGAAGVLGHLHARAHEDSPDGFHVAQYVVCKSRARSPASRARRMCQSSRAVRAKCALQTPRNRSSCRRCRNRRRHGPISCRPCPSPFLRWPGS